MQDYRLLAIGNKTHIPVRNIGKIKSGPMHAKNNKITPKRSPKLHFYIFIAGNRFGVRLVRLVSNLKSTNSFWDPVYGEERV